MLFNKNKSKTKKKGSARTVSRTAVIKRGQSTSSHTRVNKLRPKAEKKKESLISVLIKTHKDKNDGHPHVIMDNIDKNHVSVGLSTQKKKGKGKKSGNNYPLHKSPLEDGKHSYMRRQGTVAPVAEYENSRRGTMTSDDYSQAKIYADRAKQKYKDSQKKDP